MVLSSLYFSRNSVLQCPALPILLITIIHAHNSLALNVTCLGASESLFDQFLDRSQKKATIDWLNWAGI